MKMTHKGTPSDFWSLKRSPLFLTPPHSVRLTLLLIRCFQPAGAPLLHAADVVNPIGLGGVRCKGNPKQDLAARRQLEVPDHSPATSRVELKF